MSAIILASAVTYWLLALLVANIVGAGITGFGFRLVVKTVTFCILMTPVVVLTPIAFIL